MDDEITATDSGGRQRSWHAASHDDHPLRRSSNPTDLSPMTPQTDGGSMDDVQSDDAMIRTMSRDGSSVMQHPTPDLQSLQGAYVGNVDRLERSAEQLSLSGDIGEELRKMHDEQKQAESRRSSLLVSSPDPALASAPLPSRQISSASNVSNTILGLNNIARNGGWSTIDDVHSPASLQKQSSTGPYHYTQVKQIRRSSRIQHALPEPEQEGRPLDTPLSGGQFIPPLDMSDHTFIDFHPQASVQPVQSALVPGHQESAWAQPDGSSAPRESHDRPTTASSGEAYRKATNLFADFDGIHFTPHRNVSFLDPEPLASRASLSRAPLTSQASPHGKPPPVENMVFYPAPVPMMINLPPKISRFAPAPVSDKRKSQMPGPTRPTVRKSTTWSEIAVGNDDKEFLQQSGNGMGSSKADPRMSMANLPPQLRASLFFEHQAIEQDVEIKDGSAVATFESILDASTNAPVSAFVDHPIVGHSGAKVYEKSETRRSVQPPAKIQNRKSRGSMNMLNTRQSVATLSEHIGKDRLSVVGLETDPIDGPQARRSLVRREVQTEGVGGEDVPPRHDGERREDEAVHDIEDGGDSVAEEDDDPNEELEHIHLNPDDDVLYHGAPTTLLAELQMRKAQQQQRRKTAAGAFPNGMHSTLLELDKVAQIQRQSRKQKRITLAWEDLNARELDEEIEEDDDVPLGVLYPGEQKAHQNASGRFDDNVPLGLIAKREMEDNEPLSQRRARLVAAPTQSNLQKHASTLTLDIPALAIDPMDKHVEDEGETLAQRLKRLKRSKTTTLTGDFASEVLSQFGGLGDSSTTKPTTANNRSKTTEVREEEEETLGQRKKRLQSMQANAPPNTGRDTDNHMGLPYHGLGYGAASVPLSQRVDVPVYQPTAVGGGYPMAYGAAQYPYGTHYPAHNVAAPAFNPHSVSFEPHHTMSPTMMPMGPDQFPLESRQRDLIDRWRQSVM